MAFYEHPVIQAICTSIPYQNKAPLFQLQKYIDKQNKNNLTRSIHKTKIKMSQDERLALSRFSQASRRAGQGV